MQEVLQRGTTWLANNLIQKLGSVNRVDEARKVFDRTLDRNVYSWTILLSAAYAHNGHLHQASQIFNIMPARNVISSNALISAFAHNGRPDEALTIFRTMLLAGESPDHITIACAIDSCAALGSLRDGQTIHQELATSTESCCRSNTLIANTLINMYSKCGRTAVAWSIFSSIRSPDVVSWTSIVTAFAHNDDFDKAIELFHQMPSRTARNLVSWTAIITAAVRADRGDHAFDLFQRMDLEGMIKSDTLIFVTLLQGCKSAASCARIHSSIVPELRSDDVIVFNALLAAYGRCGCLREARRVFDEEIPLKDSISWNSMATALARNDQIDAARRFFDRMPQWDGVSWNLILAAYARIEDGVKSLNFFRAMNLEGIKSEAATFISMLNSCSCLDDAKRIHAIVAGSEWCGDLRLRNATINMYGRCKAIDLAKKTFEELDFRDSESWAQMIACCGQNGEAKAAIFLFRRMDLEGIQPSDLACLGVILACTETAALAEGKAIHACLGAEGRINPILCNALIDLYGKCGSSEAATAIFRSLPDDGNVICWTSAIVSSKDAAALDVFREMLLAGIQPTTVTFIGILTACSHFGCIHEALRCFGGILQDHGIRPGFDHYTCVVDLLGRAGEADQAQEVVRSMPFEPDLSAWMNIAVNCW